MNFIDIAYASEDAESTTETTQNEGIAASFGLSTQLFIFQLVNFAIVAAILWFLILKPLTKTMGERKKIIDESLENAKKVEDNLLKSEQKFKEKLDEAKKESYKIIEKAVKEGEKLSAEVKTKAKKDIEFLVDQAKVKIQSERQETMENIKKEAANLVVLALEKILNEKIDSKKDKELIEEALKGLRG